MCVCRRVVEQGMYRKHCKVEVYLMEFKLSIHPVNDQFVSRVFSMGNTVGMSHGPSNQVHTLTTLCSCGR